MAGTTDPESRPSELPPGPPYARRLDRWVEELRAAAIVNAENTEFTDFVHRMRDQFGGEDNVSLLDARVCRGVRHPSCAQHSGCCTRARAVPRRARLDGSRARQR